MITAAPYGTSAPAHLARTRRIVSVSVPRGTPRADRPHTKKTGRLPVLFDTLLHGPLPAVGLGFFRRKERRRRFFFEGAFPIGDAETGIRVEESPQPAVKIRAIYPLFRKMDSKKYTGLSEKLRYKNTPLWRL